ncbi:MAG: Npt1/Npt2 family nucleotide transporter [Candidatus Babeliaceae bacterium]
MSLSFFKKIIKPIFGDFGDEEFKKFLRLGAVFSFIIGSYWTLRPLKKAIFCTMVGAADTPWAKTGSLLFLVPLIMMYTTLLDKYHREKTFYLISGIFGGLAVVFTLLLAYTPTPEICRAMPSGWGLSGATALGYAFYIFVESYGSLIPALFWAIATDTTTPDSAKKGFSFVVALGQFGGIVGPYFIASLPRRLGLTTSALALFICAITIGISILLLRRFFTKTPSHLLVSFHGKNEKQEAEKQEPGFFEGLRLLLSHKYLLGIFAVIAFPEIITTIIDLHFDTLASQQYTGTALTEYLGMYGSSVNIVAFLFLICGIGNINRIFGVGVSLFLMPIIYALSVLGFISLNSLSFLFALMVSSKAINYALNGPAIKQLYIPTTHDVRLKSQAWIESFGSRGSKQLGSIFNLSLKPLQNKLGSVAGRVQHALYASYFSFAIIFVWFFIALFLGKKHKQALKEDKVVC